MLYVITTSEYETLNASLPSGVSFGYETEGRYLFHTDDLINYDFQAVIQTAYSKTLAEFFAGREIVSQEEYVNIGNSISVNSQPPFAEPDYRTKRDANSEWVVCPENIATTLDFALTEERYASGGEIIFKNTKEGDWISAEVYDVLGLIPDIPYGDTGLTYRQALAEEWPSVAKYIVKKWLEPTAVDGYGSFMIDTYPLNARITAGLFLRITYHASAELGERKCAVNYHLTQKL